VFENKVLRRILGPKRDEKVGGCRTLRSETANLYSSPCKITMKNTSKMTRKSHIHSDSEEKFIQDYGGKPRRKGTIRKT
jgi:hypothetical protein